PSHCARGNIAECRRAPQGLPFRDALPAQGRADLRRDAARGPGARERPPHRVPHPGGGIGAHAGLNGRTRLSESTSRIVVSLTLLILGVIPAKAGIHPSANELPARWIPAFAGMTPQTRLGAEAVSATPRSPAPAR